MNLNRAYILLGIFYSLLVLLGAIALLIGAGSPMSLIQVAIGALTVIGLWGYILDKGFLNPRIWRQLAYALGAGIVLQLVATFTASLSSVDITWMLISAVFSALVIFILHQYGDRDQELWATPEEIEGGRVLGELLSQQQELVMEKQEQDRQAIVNVSKVGERYRASVVRARGEAEERFEEHFSSLSTLAFFIEKYTCITIGDFGHKYAVSPMSIA
ncbi:hypothetical protein L861_12790 [Litchfieldella anticariensis FP35 = DSM 16096]|uniref:Uncharacterized protein n=1 Tax=Litchfieldella anticariensis (strain DSM 16096 / CECT 5854 / CIP 108499 / LMG 22089 / FP35) TaxID=1121939 RepID=S2KZ21_LITA3|nr:hypothetical protein [Halomonas anticariensis]EPC00664.1 hypothetical protein L861_12790 [Halomonas anticariensis FP35 = DSM 16096]